MINNDIRLQNFIDLKIEEKIMVLEWRNEKLVRKWMYSSEKISEEEHFNFIEKLKMDNLNQYFLVSYQDKKIGVVYFNDISYKTKETFFGLYANPFEKVAGVGRILAEVCIKYVFDILKLDKLKLEVFSENQRALNLYKKFSFKETKRKEMNGKEIICMELKNENR